MPIQQQLVIWVLIIIAVCTGIYSFASGKLLNKPEETPVELYPTQSPLPADVLTDVQDSSLESSTSAKVAISNFIADDHFCEGSKDDISMKLYTHASSVRMEAVSKKIGSDSLHGGLIFTSKKIYVWDATKKIGMELDYDKKVPATPEDIVSVSALQLGLSEEAFMAACKSQPVSASLFSVPAGIVLTPVNAETAASLLPTLGSFGAFGL